MVSTCGDLLQFASLHLSDPALAVLRDRQGAPRIHGWFDDWCLGWAWFDWDGGPAWGWDSVLPGERAVLRLFPDRQTAVVMLANSDNGRAMYRSLFAELMPTLCGVDVPPMSLNPEARHGAGGDFSPFAGSYAWPDRRIDVTSAAGFLELADDDGKVEARWVDEGIFLIDPSDPDTPTVTFGRLDSSGRPQALYAMLWGLPRVW